jgi:hypothetical protein
MGAHGHLAWLKVCGVVDDEEGVDGFLTPYLLEPPSPRNRAQAMQ